MMFNVPQFIDVEDKVAGPLTWKQLLWMIGMGVTILVLFNTLSGAFFFVVAIPTALLFIALAFYRPNGIPLPRFIFFGILFLFRPKISVWERPVPRMMPQRVEKDTVTEKVIPETASQKGMSNERLKELARILDSRIS